MCMCPGTPVTSGILTIQYLVADSVQVSHTMLAAGDFSALWPHAKHNPNDIRVLMFYNFMKVSAHQ